MLVAFDSDVLSLLLHPSIEPPLDPTTNLPVDRVRERLEFLVAELERTKAKIVLPSPALSEFLVIADEAGPDYLSHIDNVSVFRVEPFDTKAAVEAAASTRQALHEGDKKAGAKGHWQCIKTDRQIVAIAKTLGVVRIYSNDGDMQNIAAKAGIEVVHVAQLPIPPSQTPLLEGFNEAEPNTVSAVSPTEPEPLSGHSPDAEPGITAEPAPDRPSDRPSALELQQQGFSDDGSPLPPSEK